MQATCSSCSNVVTVDEKNPKLPQGPFSVKCPKCQTPVRFSGRAAAKAPRPAAAAAGPPQAGAPAPSPASTVPLKPTALAGERALITLDDRQLAEAMVRPLQLLGYEVDILSDADGVRALEQGAHVIVVMARTVAETGSMTCYQRLALVNSDVRRGFFLILVGDEYTTGDGVQSFVVHGDLVIATPDAATSEGLIRDRLIERTRLFRPFIECKRKNEAAAAAI